MNYKFVFVLLSRKVKKRERKERGEENKETKIYCHFHQNHKDR